MICIFFITAFHRPRLIIIIALFFLSLHKRELCAYEHMPCLSKKHIFSEAFHVPSCEICLAESKHLLMPFYCGCKNIFASIEKIWNIRLHGSSLSPRQCLLSIKAGYANSLAIFMHLFVMFPVSVDFFIANRPRLDWQWMLLENLQIFHGKNCLGGIVGIMIRNHIK